jgi:hypothetical protein
MSKVSKQSAPEGGDYGPVSERTGHLEGYTVNFVTFHEDVDGTPLLKGLPDDRCQCPHWGYVLSGRMTMTFADREESYEAGDAFYSPPGHIPVSHAPGTEIVLFSPSHELAETEATMQRNMKAMA